MSKKHCARCGKEFEFFYAGVGAPKSFCDSCNHAKRLEIHRIYYQNHKAEMRKKNREYLRTYRMNHRDKFTRYNREWYAKNKALRLAVENAVYDDVMKNPKKWLRKA